jgi:membrane-bound serine protease (ClpP class)
VAFLIALIVGVTLLDGPWRWVVIVGGAMIEVVEAALMIRLSRRRRPAVGPETLVGRHAVVASACAPLGQVQLDGEIWTARCPSGASRGERVRIAGVEGLTLIVEPDED